MVRLISIPLIIIFSFLHLCAQVDTTKTPKMVITLKNGVTVTGHIISNDKKYLNFYTSENQQMKILKDSVDKLIRFEDLPVKQPQKKNKLTLAELPDTATVAEHEDRNLSRMVFFPTARPMDPWQAYVQLNELFFPFAAVGIEKIIVIGGGVSLVPSSMDQMAYFSARVTPFHYENFYTAAGIFYVNSTKVFFSQDFYSFGLSIAYGMATYGDKDKSISVGLGYNLNEHITEKKPMIIIGGDIKLSKNIKLITENWIPPDSQSFLCMIGFRFIGDPVSGDVVFARMIEANVGPSKILPWFNITYNFDFVKGNYK